jgi:hypothetical protein
VASFSSDAFSADAFSADAFDIDAAVVGVASGSFEFAPDVADFVDEAFERCGVDPLRLTMRHLRSARRSLDFLFQQWSVRGANPLWTIDEQTLSLSDGVATYDGLAEGTIAIFEATIRRAGEDTPCRPMSRSEYVSISDKSMAGTCTQFYFNRALTPTVTLWPVPDNSTDVFAYWRMRRIMDVGAPADALDIPSRWYEATVAGLAEKLALKFAPDRHDKLLLMAEREFKIANTDERERGDTRMYM